MLPPTSMLPPTTQFPSTKMTRAGVFLALLLTQALCGVPIQYWCCHPDERSIRYSSQWNAQVVPEFRSVAVVEQMPPKHGVPSERNVHDER